MWKFAISSAEWPLPHAKFGILANPRQNLCVRPTPRTLQGKGSSNLDLTAFVTAYRGPLIGLIASWGASCSEAIEIAQDSFSETWLKRESRSLAALCLYVTRSSPNQKLAPLAPLATPEQPPTT